MKINFDKYTPIITIINSDDSAILINPVTHLRFLYIRFLHGELFVSTSLEWIIAQNLVKIQKNNVIEQLSGNLSAPSTIWCDIYFVPPGTRFEINKYGKYKHIDDYQKFISYKIGADKLKFNDTSFNKIFVSTLETNKKEVALLYSGGFDSSAILNGLIAEKKSISTYTWSSSIKNLDSDTLNAKQNSKKHNVNNTIVEISPNQLLSEISYKDSALITSALGFKCFNDKLYEKIQNDGKNKPIYDGHGGDALFIDSPSISILKHILDNFGYNEFYKVSEWIELHGLTFSQAIVKLLTGDRLILSNPFLLTSHIRSEKLNFVKYYASSLRSALDECCIVKHFYEEMVFPFVNINLVSYVSSLDKRDFFNNNYSRKIFRDYFNSIDPTKPFMRISKGHMTGVYQRAIGVKYEEIKFLLKNGYLAQNNLIDIDKVLFSLEYSGLGVFGVDDKLLKIIIFEYIYFSAFSANIMEKL